MEETRVQNVKRLEGRLAPAITILRKRGAGTHNA
jgi:hypothetical protein